MKTAAIICEYNPFHLGHLYHMHQNMDASVICLMSGNYVQRGDIAIFDKYARARAVLRPDSESAGADLVLELPLTVALSSAEGFATGAVSILNRLGVVDSLSFGSESKDLSKLSEVVDILTSEQFSEALFRELKSGRSFAAARERAVSLLQGDKALQSDTSVLTQPNNILAVEYLKALKLSGSTIEPSAVLREGEGYHSLKRGEYTSATAIRELILEGRDWQELVPERAADIFCKEIEKGHAPASLENAGRAMLVRLRTMSDDDFTALPYGGEGLSNRFMKYARSCDNVKQAVEQTKTKRYAYTRIKRMLMCSYLGISGADMALTPPYVRALAFNRRGQELLHKIKKASEMPVITRGNQTKRMSDEARAYFELECRAYDLYTLAWPEAGPAGLEWTQSAVSISE